MATAGENCYTVVMKRRREFGPKKQKNRSALIKFIILAAIVAVVGSGLACLIYMLIGEPPVTAGSDPVPTETGSASPGNDTSKDISFLYRLPGLIAIVTAFAVLALLFFGIRAYLTGVQVRHAMLKSRKRPKPS